MDFKALSDPVVLVGDNDNKPSFFSRIRPPLTNFKGNKILGGALTVFLLFAVGVGVYLAQKPTQLKPQASEITDNPILVPSPSVSAGDLAVQIASQSSTVNLQDKGDGNQDGKVDLQDLSILLSNWNSTATTSSSLEVDFNDDGKINSIDNLQMDQLLKQVGVTTE